jgi:hypothetical protein
VYAVSAADVVAVDSVVVVLSGADVVESSGIKEIIGAPKRWTWGVLVLATMVLCCKNARLSILRSSMLLETVRHVSEANETHETNFGCIANLHPNRTAIRWLFRREGCNDRTDCTITIMF